MTLELRRKVRIETQDVGGRIVTRLFVGDDELPATPELRRAVAQLAAGAPVLDVKRLYDAGVLEEAEEPHVPDGMYVQLHAGVAIDVDLRVARVQLPSPEGPRNRSVGPEASLPIDLFVPPYRLRPLLDLAHKVRTAWYRLLAAAGARGQPVDRVAAAERLAEVAREAVRTRPDLMPILDADDDRLVPIGPIQEDGLSYPIAALRFHGDRLAAQAGQRPALWTRLDPNLEGADAVAEMARVGQLLGALQRGADDAAVAPILDGAPATVTQLWRELARSGLAREAVARPDLGNDLPPGHVLHLGHATLLANLGGAFVLVDPWFVPSSSRDGKPPPALGHLPELAGVFFTHHHWDHVHTETLLKLDKAVPMYVPAQPRGPVVPRTAEMLAALGFTDVRVLAHGEKVAVGSGGSVEALPFLGEDPTELGFGANTYALVHGDRAAWVHVDSGPDRRGRSTVSEGVAAALKGRYAIGPIFATRRQERGTMCEYDWTFLLRPFADWTQPTENCATGAAFLGELAAASGAGSVVLYSEGGASWYPESTDFLRRGEPAAIDQVYEDGWDALSAIEAAITASGATVALSHPGDRYAI